VNPLTCTEKSLEWLDMKFKRTKRDTKTGMLKLDADAVQDPEHEALTFEESKGPLPARSKSPFEILLTLKKNLYGYNHAYLTNK
jgi:hypothetical protein